MKWKITAVSMDKKTRHGIIEYTISEDDYIFVMAFLKNLEDSKEKEKLLEIVRDPIWID